MERQAVYVKEKKEKIEKIKKKYENMNLSDDTALKINNLEVTNNILKAATAIVGLVSVINWFVPDMIPFVDEAILTGLTTLLGSSAKIVENNIDSIAKNGTSNIKMEEIQNLSGQAKEIISNLKEKNIKKTSI